MRILFCSLAFITCNFLAAQNVVHVFVALCDNKNQGIVSVPEKIGNGQDANLNLYWGCGYGVRTFFKKDVDYVMLLQEKNPRANVLERCVFKHKSTGSYVVADAYDGAFIKTCIQDFFLSCSGEFENTFVDEGKSILCGGSANLICYVGHDGLMEFNLDIPLSKVENNPRKAIMLACISKSYFKPYLAQTGANPLVWTTGLMAPEAYTLEAAITAWLTGSNDEQVRQVAATAYDKYQHCGLKGAQRLLVNGW